MADFWDGDIGLLLLPWALSAVKGVDDCGVIFVDCSPDAGK
jgi:hypothetical protein